MKVQAKPETLSDRPAVWHKLADRLLADGWLYDTVAGEWVFGQPHPIMGGVGYEDDERGIIAWKPDGSEAWLRHPSRPPTMDELRNRIPVGIPDSHHTAA